MNVYVETNFLLELALEQEQGESCQDLIRLASGGLIRVRCDCSRASSRN
ncbi:hypothetical protein SBA3_2300034 [Candidatus Sulfopaludibacter sp. SbA3]|nr:hypothetical protein SBA3_2300034 [Candidatus Sulfopaludibacter sp. SbA3]